MLTRGLLVLALLGLLAGTAEATTYYVSKQGSDANSCATASSASPTTNHKLTVAAGYACLANGSGDILDIGDGTYNESIGGGTFTKSGASSGSRLIIRARNAKQAILKPLSSGGCSSASVWVVPGGVNFIEFDGLVLDANFFCTIGLRFDNKNFNANAAMTFIRFKNGEIRNGIGDLSVDAGSGLIAWDHPTTFTHTNLNNIEILNNEIHHGGPSTECVAPDATNSVIDGNYIHHCQEAGVELTHVGGASGTIVRNNLITDTIGACIRLSYPAQAYNNVCIRTAGGNKVHSGTPYADGHFQIDPANTGGAVQNQIKFWNNTSYGRGGPNPAPCLRSNSASTGGTGNEFRNNICFGGANDDIQLAGVTVTLSNNRCGSGCTTTADPMFLDAAADNLRLSAASPATIVGAGVSLSSTFTSDKDGLFRPQGVNWDLGAYEYQTVVPAPTEAVVQYLIDEASSGQAPLALVDVGSTPLNLTLSYGSQPTFISEGTGKGLEWTILGGVGGASAAVDGTKVRTQVHGAQKVTLAVVTKITDATAPSTNEAQIALGMAPIGTTSMSIIVNGAGAIWSGLTFGSRHAYHAVVDTTQAAASNRIRLYIDGVDQGNATSGSFPALNATIDLGTGLRLNIGNSQLAGTPIGSIAGRIYNAAIWPIAATPANVLTNATALLANDDVETDLIDPNPPPGSVEFVGAGPWQATATGTSISPGLVPSSAGTDQYLAIVQSRTTGVKPTWTFESGWEVVTSCHQAGGRNIAMEVWKKTGAAPSVAPVIAISDPGFGWAAGLVAWRNTTGVVLGGVSTSTAATTWIPGSVTTLVNNTRIISVVATAEVSQLSLQTPGAWTARLTGAAWDTVVGPLALGLADITQGAPGAVAMPTWQQELNGPDEWCGGTIGLDLITIPVTPPTDEGGPPAPIPRFYIGTPKAYVPHTLYTPHTIVVPHP